MLVGKTIGIILVGFGNIAQTHLSYLRQIKHFRLSGIVDSNSAALSDSRAVAGATPLFESLEDALEFTDAGAALIATPHHVHYKQCRQCLERGMHVFCEKPVCLKMPGS